MLDTVISIYSLKPIVQGFSVHTGRGGETEDVHVIV